MQAEVDGEPRFSMLETIREYAKDRLLSASEADLMRARHRDYFLALAEKIEPRLTGAEQAQWLRRLEEEHDNMRSALERSLTDAGAAASLRLCGALQQLWWTRGHFSEGREWCERALGNVAAEAPTRERAKALSVAGVLAYCQGDYTIARARYEEALAIRKQLSDLRGIAGSLGNLGVLAFEQGDYGPARALYDESLAIARRLRHRSGIAICLNNLGKLACIQGDYAGGRALYEECLAIMRELGDRKNIAISLENLGSVTCSQGDYASAQLMYEEGLAINSELGYMRGIAYSLEGLATVIAALGASLRAAHILGAAHRLREEIGSPLPPNELPEYRRRVASARAAFGNDAVFDRSWQEGCTSTVEQAINLALEETVERR